MKKGTGILAKRDEIHRLCRESGRDPLGLIEMYPFWIGDVDPRFKLAFSVRINGSPHGKGSVRVIEYQNKRGERRHRGIQAPKSKRYEKVIAQLVSYQRPQPGFTLPLDGPLVVRLLSVKERPLKIQKKLRLPVDPAEPEGRMFAPVKPDWDNIGKSVGDGLSKGKVLAEDSRIVDGRVVTLYGFPGEDPFLEVYVFAVRPKMLG